MNLRFLKHIQHRLCPSASRQKAGAESHPKGDQLVELQVMMPPHPSTRRLKPLLRIGSASIPIIRGMETAIDDMITETEVVARFTQLNAQVLEHWIAVGLAEAAIATMKASSSTTPAHRPN